MTGIDRQLLGDVGLALDDDAYVQVIAGLGLDTKREAEHLVWSSLLFRRQRAGLGASATANDVDSFRALWTNALAQGSTKRVRIDASGAPADPDPGAVVRILSHQAVGAASVFLEIRPPEAEFRWRWPLRIGAFASDLEPFELEKLRKGSPTRELTEIGVVSRQWARSEILVVRGGVREILGTLLALPHRVRALHLIALAPMDVGWSSLRSHIDALFAETQAAALSLVSGLQPSQVCDSLYEFVATLSHNESYDVALAKAFRRETALHALDPRFIEQTSLHEEAKRLGRQLRRLPDSAPFTPPTDTAVRLGLARGPGEAREALAHVLERDPGQISFIHESGGATGLTEIARAARGARREAARSEPERRLQGDLFQISEGPPRLESRGLVVGSRYRLDVFIGPPGDGSIQADAAFRSEQLDWSERDLFNLQVIFTEPRQWSEVMQATLELPREGKSSVCRFVFVPTRAGDFSGRVTIYYRGRVLQTALLNAIVVASGQDLGTLEKPVPLRFEVETRIRQSLSTLDDRRRFDACLVVNHTAAGTPAVTAAGKEGAYIASLDGMAQQLSAINDLLTQVAHDDKKYASGLTNKANAELLGSLASEGNFLYRKLVVDYIDRSSAAHALRSAEYLQIVSTNPDALVPLEFVYEYPPPKESAPVCPNAIEALEKGRCPETCIPGASPAPHVCPLGFWGLRKVIERHLHDPNLPKVAAVRAEPIAGRNVLKLDGPSLLAASDQVPAAARSQLQRSVKAAWGAVAPVTRWEEWRDVVKNQRPVLLLALPHADGTGAGISLEISGETLASRYIDKSYVLGERPLPGPMVLLLGCDVANVAYTDAYARHIAIFREADAALVLGTVATILGKHAASVASKLVKRLATARRSTECFGDVLRQVKREAVAESLMMAMCLVAFGDADWRFE